MSYIFGLIDKRRKAMPAATLEAMLRSHKIICSDFSERQKNIYRNDYIGLGCINRVITPQSYFSRQPFIDTDLNLAIVFDGRLDDLSNLAHELEIESSELATMPDEVLTARAYRKWKQECCRHLLGDFTFVLWDMTNRQLLMARDHMGVRPLFISENADYFAFASSKHPLLALPWVNGRYDEQWVADLLCVTYVDESSTLYEEISVFPSAHYRTVDFSVDTVSLPVVDTKKYWQLNPDIELHYDHDDNYIEQFQYLLETAVSDRLRSKFPIASELSGGLDSTTVSSIAARLLKARCNFPLIAISHTLAPEHRGVYFPYNDESDWIKSLCEFSGIEQHCQLTAAGRGIVNNLERTSTIHAGPAREDLNRFGDEIFETMSKIGARVLLSGFGGDHMVSSHVFGFYEELLKQKKYLTLWVELNHRAKLSDSARQYLILMLKSYFTSFERWHNKKIKRDGLSLQGYWARLLSLFYVNPDFASKQYFPERFYDNPVVPDSGSVREREIKMLGNPSVQCRLQDSAVGAEAEGIEYRYPLLDIRLLEFCLSLPTVQKRRGGIARRMIRVSAAKTLPDKLRWRNDKTGSTIPTMHQRRCKDKEIINQRLNQMHEQLGGIEYVNWSKMFDYCKRLNKDFNRSMDGIPRAFDNAYQLLHRLMQ